MAPSIPRKEFIGSSDDEEGEQGNLSVVEFIQLKSEKGTSMWACDGEFYERIGVN
jgi:hypothetical protein